MPTNPTKILVLGIVLLATTGFTGQVRRSGPKDEILNRSTGNQSFENITTTDAFSRSLTITNVPGGIVVRQDCGEPTKHTFKRSGPTVRGLLDSLASTDRAYRWEATEGTINLRLVSGDPSLLNLRIRKLKIDGAANVRAAIDQLLSLPEVKHRVRELGLTSGYVRLGLSDLKPPGLGAGAYVKRISVKLANITLREALNAIVKAHGEAIWAYTERHCRGRKDFSVDLLRQ